MMDVLLETYYNLSISDNAILTNNQLVRDGEFIYSIMSVHNNEAFHEEEILLASYLQSVGYTHVLAVIPNKHGELITSYNNEQYIVSQSEANRYWGNISQGHLLAHFHQVNQAYPYEPRTISSYGKWKDLWINKLTIIEEELMQHAQKQKSRFYEKAMNVLPYVIGISENAIQYLQENEAETEFTNIDQGTITFNRYNGQLADEFIHFTHITYDHPIRDICEYVRMQLLTSKTGIEDSFNFLLDYESVYPLSLFSWKVLYARLLYPIHFLDLFEEKLFLNVDKDYSNELEILKSEQTNYERNVTGLFQKIERNHKRLHMHMLQWF